jgi:hypothetical protein
MGRAPGKTEPQDQGAKEWKLGSLCLSFSTETGPHCSKIQTLRSTDRSSTRSTSRCPTSGGSCPGLSERGPSWLVIIFSSGSSGFLAAWGLRFDTSQRHGLAPLRLRSLISRDVFLGVMIPLQRPKVHESLPSMRGVSNSCGISA